MAYRQECSDEQRIRLKSSLIGNSTEGFTSDEQARFKKLLKEVGETDYKAVEIRDRPAKEVLALYPSSELVKMIVVMLGGWLNAAGRDFDLADLYLMVEIAKDLVMKDSESYNQDLFSVMNRALKKRQREIKKESSSPPIGSKVKIESLDEDHNYQKIEQIVTNKLGEKFTSFDFKNVESNLKGVTMSQIGSLVLKLTNKEVTEQDYFQLTIIAVKQIHGQALSYQDFASILGCSKSYIYKVLGIFEKETGIDPATNYLKFIEWASSQGTLKASSLATLALFEKIKLIQKSASLSSLREVWKSKSPEDVFAE